jgi:hypothetical protein
MWLIQVGVNFISLKKIVYFLKGVNCFLFIYFFKKIIFIYCCEIVGDETGYV